ncbi:MAG: hypothetical protein AAFO69_19905, partial [Bacteroidota bacterium]
MMKAILKKYKMMSGALLWAALLLAGCFLQFDALAQQKDTKIRIKVQTNENGNTKTFEKEYDSKEEMLNDPEYKEFFGKEPSHFFQFGDDQTRLRFNFDQNFDWVDSLKGTSGNSFFFRSNGDDDQNIFLHSDSIANNGNLNFFFHSDDDEPSSFSFDLGSSMKDLREQMDKLREEMDANVFFFDGSDGEKNEELIEELKSLSDRFQDIDTDTRQIIIIRKKVSIEDLEEE